ncbi:MAG: GGDEF domain-containing protein [Methylococcales bacterium]|nr:GGDEF domain-containing protein [Methylococcales bacterium]
MLVFGQPPSNVNEMLLDIDKATELTTLKHTVNAKLDNISSHIVNYREFEVNRVEESQQQVSDMQERMVELEEEAETLKKLVVEKNKQATFDALTGIPNRLFFEERSEHEFSRWKRFNTPLILAIWDIDFFKKVNDNYGHKAGDKVLKTVAGLINKRIRSTDFLARFGGEEFVMLLPGTKQEEALYFLNKLRLQVGQCGFRYQEEVVNVTVSCGISDFRENDSVESVFERADQALYKAKENGRNQCVVAE